MSVVPYTTQIGVQNDTQGSQRDGARIVFIYFDKMTERQIILMKQCQQMLRLNLECLIRRVNELSSLSKKTRLFVLPSRRDDIFDRIKKEFDRPMVYLPRAIIEARSHFNTKLPLRSLVVSLTMHNSQIFIVRSCDSPVLRGKINEMNGKIVTNFNNPGTNVVLTDKADDKYCARAFKRNIPVVSKSWIDDCYKEALEEDYAFFNRDALKSIDSHRIKPFFGLYFKIMIKNSGPQLKALITENQGHIVYGNENCLTHIIDTHYINSSKQEDVKSENAQVGNRIKVVDLDFLETCVKYGYYLTNTEYHDLLCLKQGVIIKKEPIELAPLNEDRVENCTPPSPLTDGLNRSSLSSNLTMLPPPPVPRPQKQQSENMNDMIFRALSSFETSQTQHASTQMRRLPDSELRIEETFEPSQQLYWNDSVSKRN